jgi:hypothetical protein
MARVLMLLAAGPGQPEGDLAYRMELTATLTPLAALDEAAFDGSPWPVLRVLPSGRELHSGLVRVDDAWALRGPAGEDAPLWAFEGRVFRPGEYVMLRRPDGDELVFRIVDVRVD